MGRRLDKAIEMPRRDFLGHIHGAVQSITETPLDDDRRLCFDHPTQGLDANQTRGLSSKRTALTKLRAHRQAGVEAGPARFGSVVNSPDK